MPRRSPPTPPKLNAQWRCAPRTPAWEELWRRILSDVLGDQVAVGSDPAIDGRAANSPPGWRRR